uniref:Ig-like domain-containing protein n=1 Tax=Takifugu rubripes TaxID=31033 RepID=A0A3B5KVL2_TAKRU
MGFFLHTFKGKLDSTVRVVFWCLTSRTTVYGCILPCTFLPGGDTLIRWIQMSNNKCVHLYHDNKDQLESQIPSFQSRTSLFQDQISRGNASLLLMWVKVEDQGRYTCYTSTDIDNSENVIELKVNDTITCSSERIYPKPELSWSTNPPSPMRDPPKPEVQLMEDGLYNISSTIVKNSTALSYSCTVSAGRNKRKTTLFKARSESPGETVGGSNREYSCFVRMCVESLESSPVVSAG